MAENQVKQVGNYVGGDQAGQNITKVTNNFYNSNMSAYLQTLYVKFSSEENNNPLLKAFIEDLDYYNSQIEDDDVIGLEKKLIAGKRENIIWYAKDVKERFHKKLMRTSQFSEIAQKINVHLLATVRSFYILEVYPSICKGEEEMYINALIKEKIIIPLTIELGDNLLYFTHDDIQGMLYFLTGNCHIKWTS